MRFLEPLARGLALVIVITILLLSTTVRRSEAEIGTTDSGALTTVELMAKIQNSLPESIRVLSELNIQAPPQKVGERRRFRRPVYFLKENWKIKVGLEGKMSFAPHIEYIETRLIRKIKGIAYIYTEVGYDDKFEEEVRLIVQYFPKARKKLHKFLRTPSFDVDSDPAVYFIISPTAFSHDKPSVSAKVSLTDTDLSFPNSNGAEIIYIKPYSFGGDDVRNYIGFEYTHILSISHDWHDEIWMHEGLGFAAARILGYRIGVTHKAALDEFLSWKGSASDNISVCYFFLFIYDQYGLETVRRILTDPRDGKDSISYTIGKSWNELWSEYQMFMNRGPVFTRRPP